MKTRVFGNLMFTSFVSGLMIAVAGIGMNSDEVIQVGLAVAMPLSFLLLLMSKIRKEDSQVFESNESRLNAQRKGLKEYLALLALLSFSIGAPQGIMVALLISIATISIVVVSAFCYWMTFVNRNQHSAIKVALDSL